MLFPNGQDMAFVSDFPDIGYDNNCWDKFYAKKVNKKKIQGIHGTLDLTDSDVEKEYFPNRRESDTGC
jgi:hypothetical protein